MLVAGSSNATLLTHGVNNLEVNERVYTVSFARICRMLRSKMDDGTDMGGGVATENTARTGE